MNERTDSLSPSRRSVPTRKLADHLAFLTNHVVFVPDLYRGDAWDAGEGSGSRESLLAFRARVRECVNAYVHAGGSRV